MPDQCYLPEEDPEQYYSDEEQQCLAPIGSQTAQDQYGNEFIRNQMPTATESTPEKDDGGWGIMDWVHTGLDVAGLVPGIGEVADGINAVAYAAEGDKVNAGLSFAAMIPFLGWGATGAKVVGKGAKVVKALDKAEDGVSIGKKLVTEGMETGGKKGRNKLVPDPDAQGPHSVFRRGEDGRITHYEEFRPQSNPKNPNPWESTKRFDGEGKPHYNKQTGEQVETPHMHDPMAPDGVRSPTPDELPKGY